MGLLNCLSSKKKAEKILCSLKEVDFFWEEVGWLCLWMRKYGGVRNAIYNKWWSSDVVGGRLASWVTCWTRRCDLVVKFEICYLKIQGRMGKSLGSSNFQIYYSALAQDTPSQYSGRVILVTHVYKENVQ